jgi:hypothetical protein
MKVLSDEIATLRARLDHLEAPLFRPLAGLVQRPTVDWASADTPLPLKKSGIFETK